MIFTTKIIIRLWLSRKKIWFSDFYYRALYWWPQWWWSHGSGQGTDTVWRCSSSSIAVSRPLGPAEKISQTHETRNATHVHIIIDRASLKISSQSYEPKRCWEIFPKTNGKPKRQTVQRRETYLGSQPSCRLVSPDIGSPACSWRAPVP